jgi:hypothetical protein
VACLARHTSPSAGIRAASPSLGDYSPSAYSVARLHYRSHPPQHILDDFQRYAAQAGGPLAAIHHFADTTSTSNYSIRQAEIRQWLDGAQDVGAWVALDDEPLLEGAACTRHRSRFVGHVVQTRSQEGLTAYQANQAIALLRTQQRALKPRGAKRKIAPR